MFSASLTIKLKKIFGKKKSINQSIIVIVIILQDKDQEIASNKNNTYLISLSQSVIQQKKIRIFYLYFLKIQIEDVIKFFKKMQLFKNQDIDSH